MSDGLVSAVVLSFNRRDEILRCLASLKEQTYRPMEIVVLDNASSDGSADAVREAFPDVHLILMPRNYGDWEGRDIAAANCRGEYLFSLDDDATAEKDTVEKLVARMKSEPELAVVQAQVIDPPTGEPYQTGFGAEYANRSHYRATFLGGAALFRSVALQKAGGFPHYLLGGAESFLSYRFLDMGCRIFYCSETAIYHVRSAKARIPHQRCFLSSKQRLRALMSHYPGLARPAVEMCCKLASYTAEALRRGYVLHLPKDLFLLFLSGLREWRGPWRITKKTVRLVDYLRCYPVETPEEYAAIPVEQGHFLAFASRRFRKGRGVNRFPFGQDGVVEQQPQDPPIQTLPENRP